MEQKDPLVKTINVSKSERDKAKQKMLSIGDGQVGRNINYMIQSRFKIIYIQSHEERRVIDFFRDLSLYRGSEILQWDCDRGLLDAENKEQVAVDDSEVHENPIAVLAHIIDRASNQAKKISYGQKSSEVIFLLLDFHSFLEDAPPQIERKLKEFSDVVSTCTIVIVAPNFVCPSTLEKEITLVDFPVPSYKEVKETLFEVAKAISTKLPKALKQAKDNEEDLVKAASGLTLTESENAYAMTIVRDREFNIKTILNEKKQAIRKSGILEYLSPKFTLDQIGGLDTLKEWLMLRRVAFRDDARSFGLPIPRGVLLLGISGCGKSMAAEATASAYEMPLLRLDMGAIFSSHVGDSEANIRSILKIAESVSPCVLWLDEVEKGIGGVESSNSTDGGVTGRVFGTLLSWMQDKRSPVFMVCTANKISGIPPEFMRAGRFDEVFFIDLPDEDQRFDVLEKLISCKGRSVKDFDLAAIVLASENYSPAEIEKGIDNGLFRAYAANKRKLCTQDIVDSLVSFPPLYNSRREEINTMRDWAFGDGTSGGRAVKANSTKSKKKSLKKAQKKLGRIIEIDSFDV